MNFPYVPQKYLSDFVRGYFDGDGCVSLCTAKNSKGEKIIKKLSVIFTCGSRVFLERLANELHDCLLLKQDKIYNSHRSFQLRYTTADSLKLFKFFYKDVGKNLFLNRKFVIFGEYFRIKLLSPKDR